MQYADEGKLGSSQQDGEAMMLPYEYGVMYANQICTTAKNTVTETVMRLATLENAILSPAFTMLPQDKQNDMKEQWYHTAMSLTNEVTHRA
jgi:hypothetical protein